MPTIEQIEPKIVSTLQLVPEFKRVYNHEPKDLGATPAATMYFDGFGQTDGTSRRKNRTFRWIIRVYVPLQDQTKAQAEIKLIVQAVMDRLAANLDLDGTVTKHNLVSGEVYAAMDQSNPCMIAEMTMEAEVQHYY